MLLTAHDCRTSNMAGDGIMISSLDISNFRGFKQLHLDGLRRFNIIVGESGSGKTALLESIFLVGAANPTVWLKLR